MYVVYRELFSSRKFEFLKSFQAVWRHLKIIENKQIVKIVFQNDFIAISFEFDA